MFTNATKSLLGTSLIVMLTMATDSKAECPTLNLQTLPTAVCASEKDPYRHINLKYVFGGNPMGMKYVASQSECSKDKTLGLRKLAQSIFKGQKDYPGKEIVTKAGTLQCKYTLDEKWKEALHTDKSEIILKTPLSSSKHILVGKGLCPELNADNVGSLIWKKPIERFIEDKKDGSKFDYSLKLATDLGSDKKTESKSNSAFGTLGKKIQKGLDTVQRETKQLKREAGISKTPALIALKPSAILQEAPFTHTCTYSYKKGSTGQTLTLQGTSTLSN